MNARDLKAHYERLDVQYEIAKACAWRECVAISPKGTLRPFKQFRVQDVQYWINRLRPWETEGGVDYYQSVASVNLPPLPSSWAELKEASQDLKETWMDRVKSWSFFMDIDVEDPDVDYDSSREIAVQAAMEAGSLGLDNPYLVFSGTGWNVRASNFPTKRLSNGMKEMRDFAMEITHRIGLPRRSEKTTARVQCDDLVYDARRICRIPFTISRKSGLVVTPMTIRDAASAPPMETYAPKGYAWPVRNRMSLVEGGK